MKPAVFPRNVFVVMNSSTSSFDLQFKRSTKRWLMFFHSTFTWYAWIFNFNII